MTIDQLVDEVTAWGDRQLTKQFAEAFDSLLVHWEANRQSTGLRGTREMNRFSKVRAAWAKLQDATKETV